MVVFVNDQTIELERAGTLQELLAVVHHNLPKGIAVAINNVVIPKSTWATHRVEENDRVVLIRATQGG